MVKNKLICFILIFFSIINENFSQNPILLSGYIKDSISGEVLINAAVFDKISQKGAVTNNYGYYCVSIKEGTAELIYSYIGYKNNSKVIKLTKDTIININLKFNNELSEVEVAENKGNFLVKQNSSGVYNIDLKDIKKQPVLLGEVDILKSIQLIPGIQAGKEGTAGFNVRGGSPDQNLILLDGIPVYNVNHLYGFFSLFNADAINSVKVIKGGIPAEYGGRLSSVVDIYLKEGNNKKFVCNAGIGIISSKITIEGPIIKNKASFMLSGRRTYMDVLNLMLSNKSSSVSSDKFYFYDLYSKINYTFSNKSRIYASAYLGSDFDKSKSGYSNVYPISIETHNRKNELSWGNKTMALRWNYLVLNNMFLNITGIFSDYNYLKTDENNGFYSNSQTNETATSFDYSKNTSGIRDYGSKADINYVLDKHNLYSGVNYTYHIFNPGMNFKTIKNNINQNIDIDTTFGSKNIYAKELSAYFKDNYKISDIFSVDAGIHFNTFNVKNKIYHSFEPRIILIAQFGNYSFNASYTENNQNIHLITNNTIGLPTDLWLPSTDKIKPQKAKQMSVGSNYSSNFITIGVDAYYKEMSNLIEYSEGAFAGLQNSDWQQLIETGKGKAFGIELLMQKSISKFDFYVAYCYSKSTRQFDNISFGQEFPYRYDHRHNITITAKYKINPNIDFSLAWYYSTGDAVTLSTQKYISNFLLTEQSYNLGTYNFKSENDPNFQFLQQMVLNKPYSTLQIDYYEHRNNYRMPAYHRMDISINFQKQKKHYFRTFSLGVYNVYNKQNVFYYYYDKQFVNSKGVIITLKQITLFSIIPFINYSIKF